jgi:tetratricopeptide (TPR) repeat protein
MKRQSFFNGKMLLTAMALSLVSATVLWSQEKMPITTSSREARELFLEGRQQLENFQWQESYELMEKAIELDPFFAMAYLYQSQAIGQGKGYYEEILDKAYRLSELVSEPEKERILYARAYQRMQKDAMKQHVDAMRRLCPHDERLLNLMGWYHYQNGDYGNAAIYYERATKENDQFHPAFKMLGESLMALGKKEKAEPCFKRYVELLPGHPDPHMSYARFLKKGCRYNEAVQCYRQALDLDPHLGHAYKDLGDMALFQGKAQLAGHYYQDLYEHASTTAQKFWALRLKASVNLHEGKFKEAMQIMDEYAALARKLGEPYYQFFSKAYQGLILTEDGQMDQGLKQYRDARKVLTKADMHKKLKERLITQAHLWEYNAMARNGCMDEPETVKCNCEEMLSEIEDPEQWERYHRLCGVIEINKGNFRKARKYLKRSGDHPLTWYYMALANSKSGREKKARKWYRKIVEHHNNSIHLSSVRRQALARVQE